MSLSIKKFECWYQWCVFVPDTISFVPDVSVDSHWFGHLSVTSVQVRVLSTSEVNGLAKYRFYHVHHVRCGIGFSFW